MIIALLISLFLLLGMPMMGQMMPINLPADGDWPTIVGDSIMLIGPKQEALTEEQRYFNPPYLLVYPGKEHLKEQMIRAALCDCDPTKPNRRIGVFSVSGDKKVSFSQGNLQYLPAINLWKFANTQYEYLGNANKYLTPTFRNWVDLFGWSASGTNAPFGVSTSTDAADYAGEFVDWGVNTISCDAPGTWRTLSIEEWNYLFENRANATQLYGVAQVAGINGMIILPDDWVAPDGITFQPGCHKSDLAFAQHQTFTEQQWLLMETAGAIFLPAAGIVYNSIITAPMEGAHYQSSDKGSDNTNYWFGFRSSYYTIQNSETCTRRSVRLVHDTIVPKPEPEYVDLGLSVKWATFNVGATSPEDYGEYFAWGETEPKEEYTWTTYKWCDGTQNTMTKYCSDSLYDNADYKTTLDPEDDAAIVRLGGNWRMPAIEEWRELKQKCTWERITINGITGYQVTGKNGNSIFLPRAGLRIMKKPHAADSVGYYASSSHISKYKKENYFNFMRMCDSIITTSSGLRYYGYPIRPVYDDRPTLTVIPTPEDAKVSFHCSDYQWAGNSITVDKGQNVLYQVTNVDAGYLSQGDSIYNLTKDSVLHITLRPFSDGNWIKVDKSELTKQEGYYIHRGNCAFASTTAWNYYVLPVLPGETYRVRGIAGQQASLWMVASTAPDLATETRPTKISCCQNRGIAAYIVDEVTIPENGKYLIISTRKDKETVIERKVPDPCLVVKVNDTLSINLMCVEGGTFRMGVGADNYIERDDPQANKDSTTHLVTLSDYYMAETAVTQGLWKAVMGTDIHDMVAQSRYPDDTPKVGDRYPMGYVFLKDALAFVDELNKLTGLHFRLPTEAEREYAARGGKRSRDYKYPGSNDYSKVASPYGTPVAQKLPNELGIYDLSGGTREMCTDSWQTTYIYDEHVVNPVGPILSAGNRTMRGGHIHSQARPFTRYPFTPTWCRNELGFRIILPTETKRRMVHVNGSFFEMCFVEGGTFMMGSDAPDAEADEQPVHEVTLSDYYIGQTEVTQHLWKKVMGDDNNPSATKGNNLPVTNITWDEAQVFVQKLSELTGMRFRLPTEAEWEYAARGGQMSQGYTYAGSNNADSVAWHIWNTTKLQAVGQLLPNELGIFDMTGNVWEYCSDYYAPYEASAQVNPQGPQNSHSGIHVTRGGGWRQNPGYDTSLDYCRVTSRTELSKSDIVGLRIVLEPQIYYRYGFTQEDWDAATSSWGHQGRGHAPADQSCIQGTMVHGIRLKIAKAGSLNVYKVPSLLEKTEDNFELVATLTTDRTGVQDFDFAEPIYIAPNEYLVFGKPSEEEPTLRPFWLSGNASGLPEKAKGVAHYIGTEKAEVAAPNGSLMVEFY